jgi:hypothetical protein
MIITIPLGRIVTILIITMTITFRAMIPTIITITYLFPKYMWTAITRPIGLVTTIDVTVKRREVAVSRHGKLGYPVNVGASAPSIIFMAEATKRSRNESAIDRLYLHENHCIQGGSLL